jgi:hypothetical protein
LFPPHLFFFFSKNIWLFIQVERIIQLAPTHKPFA